MGTFMPLSNTNFDILINNEPVTNYTTTEQNITLNASNNPNSIPDGSLLNETNFAVSTSPQVPDNIVPGELTIKILKSALSTTTNYLGFRLSASSANTNFSFKTTNTDFSAGSKTISSNTSVTKDVIVWSSVDIATIATDLTETGYILIPVEINYTSSTPDTSVTFFVDLYEMADPVNGTTPTFITTISDTDSGTPRALSVTSYTAAMTTSFISAVPTSLTVSKTSFYKGDPIALKTGFTTTSTAGYKPATNLVLTNSITANITPVTLYASLIDNATDQAALDTGVGTNTVKVSFSSLPTDVAYNTTANTVTVTMNNTTGSFTSLFTGTGSTLPTSNVYIYIIGNVSGIGA